MLHEEPWHQMRNNYDWNSPVSQILVQVITKSITYENILEIIDKEQQKAVLRLQRPHRVTHNVRKKRSSVFLERRG